jgi:hypothetical protein
MIDKFKPVKRINHVPELVAKNNLQPRQFVKEAAVMCDISDTTLEKALRKDETEFSYDVIERLAWYFNVTIPEVLESKL